MLKRLSRIHPLTFILVAALLIRLIGIEHGFPKITHPDEPTIIRSALGIRFDPNTKHFDWPHLYIYLNYFVYFYFSKVRNHLELAGLKEAVTNLMPLMWNDNLIFYYLTRAVSALFGAFTAIPIYLAAKTIFNKRIGLWAALVMCFIPFHVRYSHYALTEAPMVFLIAWAIYFCARAYLTPKLLNYILAGFFVGLAASTKYNGVFIAVSVFLAYVMYFKWREYFNFKNMLKPIFSALACVIAFLIGTPYALLDSKNFLRSDSPIGALWQFQNVGKVSFEQHIFQFFRSLTVKLPEDFGYTFFIAFLFVFGYLVYELIKTHKLEHRNLWFFVLPAMLFIYYVSGLEKYRSHYFMITYPYVAITAGYFIDFLLGSIKKRYLKVILCSVFFVIPVIMSIIHIISLANKT